MKIPARAERLGRPRGGDLEGRGERLAAIEVKTNAEASTDGLAEFRRRFRPAASLIVGPAGMPLAEFLALDPADLLR